MLDRFIYFRHVINLVLNKANNLSNSKKKEINLDTFNLKLED